MMTRKIAAPRVSARPEVGSLAGDLCRLFGGCPLGVVTRGEPQALFLESEQGLGASSRHFPTPEDVSRGEVLENAVYVVSDCLEHEENPLGALERIAHGSGGAQALVVCVTEKDLAGEGKWNFSEARELVEQLEGWKLVSQGLTLTSPRYFERSASLFVLVPEDDGVVDGIELSEILGTGIKNLRLDMGGRLPLEEKAVPAPKVCVVTEEIYGPSKCGGIGTAYTSLVDHLASVGHKLTVLFIGHLGSEEPMEHWVEFYAEKGIELVQIDIKALDGKLPWEQEYFRRGFLACRWLMAADRDEVRRFDVIHFAECNGFGYYTAKAKKCGIAFAQTTLCIGTHGSTRWAIGSNHLEFESTHQLIQDYTEKESLRDHDVLVGPSQYLIHWMRGRGWELPQRCYQQQYVQPHSARATPDAVDPLSAAPREVVEGIEEIVFFGRLETRKGLLSLCDALNDLVDDPAMVGARITFLGKDSLVDGIPATRFVWENAESWPWEVQCLTDKNQTEAVSYLKGEGRLAIVPSLNDNSPNTVYECVGLGIPFLTGGNSGILELMHPEDVAGCTFYDRVEQLRGPSLAKAIRRAFTEGVRPPRPAVCQVANEHVHDAWHHAEAVRNRGLVAQTPKVEAEVTACLLFQGEDGLEELAEQIRQQAGAMAEVLIVHDEQVAEEEVQGIAEKVGARCVSVPGRAWFSGLAEAAVEAASGEVLVFARPGQVFSTDGVDLLVGSLFRSEGDVVTGMVQLRDSDEKAEERFVSTMEMGTHAYFPVGDAVLLPFVMRLQGDVPFAIKKDALQRAGGFSVCPGNEAMGWDQLMNWSIQGGLKVDVVPEFVASCFDHRAVPKTTADFYLGERMAAACEGLFTGSVAELLPSYLRASEQHFQGKMVEYWDLNWRASEGFEKVSAELEEERKKVAILEAEIAKGMTKGEAASISPESEKVEEEVEGKPTGGLKFWK